MKRKLIIFLLTCWVPLGLPATAGAAPSSVAGKVVLVGGYSFTVQTPGKPLGVINALTQAADRVTRSDYPYVYGGGHAQVGVASVGIKGPGYNGKRIGFDCSGSVAAVLAGGGLWPAGAGVPNDAGIVSELLSKRVIAPGAGSGPVEVTLYDHPGYHIFMNIDGRFFGTSDGGGGGNPRGGAGWLDDGAPDASSRAYKRYHVVPSALRQDTDAAHSVTFARAPDLAGLQVGDEVRVNYRDTKRGVLVATAIAYPGAITALGVVSAIAADDSAFTLTTGGGTTLSLTAAGIQDEIHGLAVGDTVRVTYTKGASGLVARSAAIVAAPAPSSTSGPQSP